ncbi:MAG: DUF3592 domain-containing protein [Eubacterium sp.]|nr:DUF3592 domain-containing protein [Eubacterium sp.]
MNELLLFAILIIGLGLYMICTYIVNSKKQYIIVHGKIIDFKEHRNQNGNKGFTTVFEYYYQGMTYTAEHNINLAKYMKNSRIEKGTPKIYYTKNISIVPNSKYKIGDSIDVRVYTDNPENAIINTKSSVLLPLITGLISLTIGAVVLIVYYIG